MLEIGVGTGFVIAGTEVFHRACAARIATSVLTRTRTRLAHEQERRIAAEVRAARAETGRSIDAQVALDRAKDQRGDLNKALEDLARRTTQVADLEQQLAAMRTELDLARANAAWRELAASSTTRTAMPDPVPPTPVASPDPPVPDHDDAEIRFGLLELDLPK